MDTFYHNGIAQFVFAWVEPLVPTERGIIFDCFLFLFLSGLGFFPARETEERQLSIDVKVTTSWRLLRTMSAESPRVINRQRALQSNPALPRRIHGILRRTLPGTLVLWS
jgi:hypothetical protein